MARDHNWQYDSATKMLSPVKPNLGTVELLLVVHFCICMSKLQSFKVCENKLQLVIITGMFLSNS